MASGAIKYSPIVDGGTLSGNVITVANNAPVGLSLYPTSNNPTNCPTNGKWGAYLILKQNSIRVAVLYFDQNMMASTAYLDPTTATTITWHIT